MALNLQPWIAVIVFITLSSYIPMTIWLTEWRGKFRRELNRLDNAKGAKATDALLNYETVKYFGNEPLERRNFAAAIDAYQVEDYRLSASMNYLNVAQSLVIFSGMAAGLLVCTKGISNGTLTVGDAVLFVTLMQQLYAPLNFFGTYYRLIQQATIDMENMFDLLSQHPGIQDAPGAKALVPSRHTVALEDVTFEYNDGTPVLKGVSLAIPGGATAALVGATGSGKSTILRLLFRFYDPQAGAVLIDGQDITRVTQASLRAAIGVVLFNDTIRYNIRRARQRGMQGREGGNGGRGACRGGGGVQGEGGGGPARGHSLAPAPYGRPEASDAEVEAAAEAACIHETISTKFPNGYDTVVGERGLRLSGGEKQRVAFARALLRNPPILILDEATSALDSITERRIQASLAEARTDRTVIIVAHRLSTIMDADQESAAVDRGSTPSLASRAASHANLAGQEAEGEAAPPSPEAAQVQGQVAGPARPPQG
eukprot:scaffold5.g615.t1